MIRRNFSGLLVPLLAALAPARARPQALPDGRLAGGTIDFAVQVSNAPNFTGHATVSEAAFTGADLAAVRGYAEVRVADMHTGIGLRDHHMRNAMEADSFPLVRFDLTGVTRDSTRADTVVATCRGRLTLHGQAHDVAAPCAVVVAGTSVDVAATFPVDMREYGIKPPTRFFGAVRVQPVVGITARLRFGAAPATAP